MTSIPTFIVGTGRCGSGFALLREAGVAYDL